MAHLKLIKKIFITGEIEAKTGLLIGGTNSAIGIGGVDKTVVRNPITEMPYIPGSSLKGRMRALLEISYGFVKELDRPIGKLKYVGDDTPELGTTLLFGSAQQLERNAGKQKPSRIIVRDGHLINGDELEGKTDLPFTESKTEVMIDRITSHASPRTFERVPAGAKFSLDIILNIFEHADEHKNETELLDYTIRSLQLLQDDYLGGSGSRGYGQIKIYLSPIRQRLVEYYHTGNDSFDKDYTYEIPKDLK